MCSPAAGVEAGLRVLAYVKEARGVRAIVEHLGLPTAGARLASARAPPSSRGVLRLKPPQPREPSPAAHLKGARPGPACTPRGCAASPPTWRTARAAPVNSPPRPLWPSPPPLNSPSILPMLAIEIPRFPRIVSISVSGLVLLLLGLGAAAIEPAARRKQREHPDTLRYPQLKMASPRVSRLLHRQPIVVEHPAVRWPAAVSTGHAPARLFPASTAPSKWLWDKIGPWLPEAPSPAEMDGGTPVIGGAPAPSH
jgi:hypothetical protein